jgi:hypothetical protein
LLTVALMTSGITRPRSTLCGLSLALLGLGAHEAYALSQACTVEIRPVLNDPAIKIEHVARSSMRVLNLTNNSPTRVRCDIHFDPSPQTPGAARDTSTRARPGRARCARTGAGSRSGSTSSASLRRGRSSGR